MIRSGMKTAGMCMDNVEISLGLEWLTIDSYEK